MIEELKKLGLTNNEAKVYLALLELGSTSAGKIIKRTKLHRNIVYDNLDKLMDKGLVSFVIVKNIKHFETAPPEEIKEYIEKQKKDILKKEKLASQILPEIEKRRESIERQEASIFKGKKALKPILEEMTKAKTDILVFGTGSGMETIMGHYYKQWHVKLIENKTKGRILIPSNKRGKFLKPFIAKYLPERDITPSTIALYDDKVLNIIWTEEPIGILIISKIVAKSYENYFEVLWKIAKN